MLNHMTTFDETLSQVAARSANHHDATIAVTDVTFKDLETVKIGENYHPLKPIASRSIASRLGTPFSYLQKCSPDIQAANLNHWIRREERENFLFRFDGNSVRAVFTERYTPMDNLEVLQELEASGIKGNTRVQTHIDDGLMLINIPEPDQEFAIQKGDEMMPGISITNSEVGLSCLSLSSFLFRLICTNGMITTDEIARSTFRHTSDRGLRLLPEILKNKVIDMEKHKGQFRIALDSPVDDPSGTFRSFNKRFLIRKDEKDAISWAWPQERGETMFNIINTYTRAAQHPSLPAESASRLQRTGGQILSLLK